MPDAASSSIQTRDAENAMQNTSENGENDPLAASIREYEEKCGYGERTCLHCGK